MDNNTQDLLNTIDILKERIRTLEKENNVLDTELLRAEIELGDLSAMVCQLEGVVNELQCTTKALYGELSHFDDTLIY